MSAPIAVIDTNGMSVLSEFDAQGEPLQNRFRFRLGTVADDFIIASQDGTGGWRGISLFEKRHLAAVAQGFDDLLEARLPEPDFQLADGKDEFHIESAIPRAELFISLGNNRKVFMDGIELGGWFTNLSLETAKMMRDELLRLAQQGIT